MMNIDQARAGGEGVISSVSKKKKKDPNVELDESSPIYQSQEKPLKLAVPEGWSVNPSQKEG
jgi:hypothetical protein